MSKRRKRQQILPEKGVEITLFTDLPKDLKRDLRAMADDANPVSEAAWHELRERIAKVLKLSSVREREIIRLHYGLGGQSYTLEEVAHIFRATRARIRQIEAAAMKKLQRPSNSIKLSGFED